MKILKWILIVLVAIIAIFLVYSSTQPNKAIVSESIEINKPAKVIYQELVNFPNWGNWSVWSKMDPDMKNVYSEKMGEVGSSSEWTSENPNVGSGKQEVVELRENEYMKLQMNFADWPGTKYAEFILKEQEGVTTVTWTYEGSETPFYLNFTNGFIETMLAQNYKDGLVNMKSYMESLETVVENPKNLEIVEVEPQNILSIKDSTTAGQISKKLMELYTELSIYLEMHKDVKANGKELALYHFYSPDKVILEAAIPYSGKAKNDGRVVVKQTPSGKVIKGIHYGSYETSGDIHEAIEKYMTESDIEYIGPCWEVYMNNASEVNPESLETQVFYPIK
ncbi:MAG: hypothetical protein DWP98_03820 [Bacteroidetes bacterium]|nr:MAG: hypothetical protein DWP98_03820 [Bacteroidota bacterium]MBL1144140.1 hypothetical protein [Bacteroidota bacterium]MCB0803833.1 SRPBCC family protein [Flavobacteriales bacterium]NOG56935.1 hypothetical protein [Bacteroidota bacterium]